MFLADYGLCRISQETLSMPSVQFMPTEKKMRYVSTTGSLGGSRLHVTHRHSKSWEQGLRGQRPHSSTVQAMPTDQMPRRAWISLSTDQMTHGVVSIRPAELTYRAPQISALAPNSLFLAMLQSMAPTRTQHHIGQTRFPIRRWIRCPNEYILSARNSAHH